MPQKPSESKPTHPGADDISAPERERLVRRIERAEKRILELSEALRKAAGALTDLRNGYGRVGGALADLERVMDRGHTPPSTVVSPYFERTLETFDCDDDA